MSASAAPATPTPAPRWGIQASIIQPRQPAFWLFLVLLGIGGVIFADEQSYFSQLPTALTLSWVLVLAYAVPVFWLVNRLDLFEREPTLMLVAALLWGGVVAAGLAGYANGAWLSVMSKVAPLDVTAQWGPAVVGPSVEETLKLMGVVVLFLIVPYEFDGVMDGFVYGAMVGLGFTVVEDVSYFIHAASAFGTLSDQTGPVIDTFLIRVVAGGLYTHVLFSGITGLGFAYFATHKGAPMGRRVLGFGACVAAGVAAHAIWNSPWLQTILQLEPGATAPTTLQWVEYGTLKGSPFLILLAILVVFATRSEEKSFQAIVAGEPDPTIVPENEIRSLRSLLARRSARAAAGRVRGRKGSRLAGKIQAAQIEYALIRSRVDSLTDPALEAQRVKIRGLRQQYQALPIIPVPVPVPKPAPVAKAPPAAEPAAEKQEAAKAAAPKPVAPKPAAGDIPAAAAGPAASGAAAGGAFAVAAAGALSAEEAPLAAEPVKPEPAGKPGRAARAAAEAKPAPEAKPEPAAKPAPEARPAPAAPQAAAPAWAPTHVVPPGGMAAWAAPDPTLQPMVNLPERLELVVEQRAGAWALVHAVNGWRGWVDGRRLLDRK